MTKKEMRAAVVRGAKLLDQRVPGWADLIDLTIFNISSPQFCILGQVFVKKLTDALQGSFLVGSLNNGFEPGLNFLGLDDEYHHGQEHGFDLLDTHENGGWDTLASLWIPQIVRRQTKA